MKIKATENYVDTLERSSQANQLVNIISTVDNKSSLVLMLNAEWGDGKTFFLQNILRPKLITQGISVIYYDAFLNDYDSDPFISISQTLIDYHAKYSKENLDLSETEVGKNFIESFRKVLAKPTGNIMGSLPLLTALLIQSQSEDKNPVTNQAINDIAKSAGKLIDQKTANAITPKTDEDIDVDIRDDFQTKLTALTEEMNQDKPNPLVFIVDELDRCRPTFSLEILEKIKHFFSTKNIVFILAVDKSEFSKTLKVIYGNIDTNKYLQKFIDVESVLRKPVMVSYNQNQYGNFIGKLLELHDFKPIEFQDIEVFINQFSSVCIEFKPSLREIQRVFTYAIIAMLSLKKEQVDIIFFFIAMLKIKNYDTFVKIRDDLVIFDDLIKTLAWNSYLKPHSYGSSKDNIHAISIFCNRSLPFYFRRDNPARLDSDTNFKYVSKIAAAIDLIA